MTKKDYVLIAKAIRSGKELDNQIVSVISYLVDALALDNPNFDRMKFIEACGFRVLNDTSRLSEE